MAILARKKQHRRTAPRAPAHALHPLLILVIVMALKISSFIAVPSAHGLAASPRRPTSPKYRSSGGGGDESNYVHADFSKAATTEVVGGGATNSYTPAGAGAAMTRRSALIAASAAALSASAALLDSSSSAAADSAATATGGPPERVALLKAISSGAPEATVTTLISKLEPLDPSKSTGATSPYLGGRWELIYSINAEAFSPLLNLPAPVRPTSLQLLGDAAAEEVGAGRVAQVLNFPLVSLSVVLSSGTVPVRGDATTLEIFPPFRLEAVLGSDRLRSSSSGGTGAAAAGARVKLVESGSDADFRALNARDQDAQDAGRNMYKQRYLEVTGKPGDLRISEVVAGDPVIVGAVFVHRRL